MLIKIKSKLPHKIEDKLHYGNFKGSFNFFRQLSWNICHPNRLINRLRWLNFLKSDDLKKKNFKKKLRKIKDDDDLKNSSEFLEDKFNYYIDNGGVVLKEFFSETLINQFYSDYKEIIEKIRELNDEDKKLHVVYKKKILPLTENLIKLWLNERLKLFIKESLNGEIFAREYPILYYSKKNCFNASLKEVDKKNFLDKIDAPTGWHVDHTAGLTNLHILLEDIDENSTHMEFLPGSHKYANMTDAYSDETVQKFKTKPIKCIGKRGTIYFHNGNTLHRVVSNDKDRLSLIMSFSPGTGIAIDSMHISLALSSNFDLENLSFENREILKGIFPLSRFVEIGRNKISDAKFSAK